MESIGKTNSQCKYPNGPLLEQAIEYAGRGYSVIPVSGKRAVGRWKPFQTQRPDKATIRRLFTNPNITGLAVITGRVSGGLAVRDFDEAEAYHTWANNNPGDADRLPTVKTGRGYHVYGRLEAEVFEKFYDGELRGTSRHIVVAPPSAHPDGHSY